MVQTLESVDKLWSVPIQTTEATEQDFPVLLFTNVLYKVILSFDRSTQRIVSVNYLSVGIPYDFLKGIFTSNFRDMGNLRPIVFENRIDNYVVSGTKERSAKIFGKEIRPKVFEKWTKMP